MTAPRPGVLDVFLGDAPASGTVRGLVSQVLADAALVEQLHTAVLASFALFATATPADRQRLARLCNHIAQLADAVGPDRADQHIRGWASEWEDLTGRCVFGARHERHTPRLTEERTGGHDAQPS
jgi:hypothetical protein